LIPKQCSVHARSNAFLIARELPKNGDGSPRDEKGNNHEAS
jgi:hypothetical protein